MPEFKSPVCPRCASSVTARVKRVGFLQNHVLPHLDRYPWECAGCRSIFTFKSRGKIKRRRSPAGEIHMPPITQ